MGESLIPGWSIMVGQLIKTSQYNSSMAPPDTALELARRAVARILYNETPFRNDDNNVTFVLADIMALGN